MGANLDHLAWRRSSRCSSGSCVEWAADDETVYLRDSKDIAGPMLRVGRDEWIAFVDALKRDALQDS